jgi:hypothetical protein
MLLYSNDYQDELPRAGGRNSTWGTVNNWMAADRYTAFGLDPQGGGGKATISSCFYLLVKYTEVTPKSFLCKGDAGTSEFKLSDVTPTPPANFELIDGWDFGPAAESWKHCSYSYHMPFGLYALTVSSEPGFAVAADRNPFLKSPAAEAKPLAGFVPDLTTISPRGTQEQAKEGNAIAHQLDGQNVMFLDTHVNFEKRSYCSIEDDNIYLVSPDLQKGHPRGNVPVVPNVTPANRKDSVLVHDPGEITVGPPPRPTR